MVIGERWCVVFSGLATALSTACGSSPTAPTPVSQTPSPAPRGTPTLSGVVFDATPSGRTPVAGAQALIGISSGWRGALSDANGFYSIPGLFNVTGPVHASKDGFHTPQDTSVAINGDTVLDIGLVRR